MLVLPRRDVPLNPISLTTTFRPDPGVPIWGDGCNTPPGATTVGCSADGSATLVNASDAPRRMTLHATLQPGAKPARWKIGDQVVRVARAPRPVQITFTVPARTTQRVAVDVPKGGGTLTDAGVLAA
jgi:hypothetical protein